MHHEFNRLLHLVLETANSCRYEIMNKCIGGLERIPSIPAYMTLTAEVVEKQGNKTVYTITKPQSFPSSDVGEWEASAKPARALGQWAEGFRTSLDRIAW